MPSFEKSVELLKKVPEWGKWLAGVAALAGTIGALLLQPLPFLVVLLGVSAGVLLYSCAIVVTRTRPSLLDGPPVRVYSRTQRRLAAAGIIAIVTGNAALLALPSGRALLYHAFVPRPLLADVVIAEFRGEGTGGSLRIPERIGDAIEKQLHLAGMGDVKVSVDSVVIRSDEQASSVARSRKAKAVIWGWHDPHGIKVNLHLAGDERLRAPGLDEIPLALSSADSFAITVLRRDVIPGVAFLSLFVLGYLHYERNEYSRGLAAFDAAMRVLPSSAPISERSIVYFFQARARSASLPDAVGPDDPALNAAVCDYAEAIRLAPEAPEAYNNLGVLLARVYRGQGLDANLAHAVHSENARACIHAAAIGQRSIADLLLHASTLRPRNAVFAYNAFAADWMRGTSTTVFIWRGDSLEIRADPAISELESLIRMDPTVPGPHLLLGVIRFDQGRVEEAASHFSTGARSLESSKVRVNLAQALLRQGREQDARKEFEAALALNPHEPEARIGLAKLAIRARRYAAARQQLDQMGNPTSLNRFALQAAAILRSEAWFEEGDPVAAQRVLEHWINSELERCQWTLDPGEPCPGFHLRRDIPLEHLLLLSLARVTGDPSAYTLASASLDSIPLEHQVPWRDRLEFEWPEREFLQNASGTMAWVELLARCVGPGSRLRPASSWGEDGQCLPAPAPDRLRAIYAAFHFWLDRRIYYRTDLFLSGMACPFVYTYDRSDGAWVWEGTILTSFAGQSRQAVERIPLSRFDGRVLIREMDPEVSFIDHVRIIVRDSRGHERVIEATDPRLRASDERYVVLRPGEEMVVEFDRDPHAAERAHVWIEASGFYLPLRKPRPPDL